MASITKERMIEVSPEEAWDALRDWGKLHERLVAGFVLEVEVDGDDRILTFFNGRQARERIVGLDEERRRLAWTVVDGPFAHYNGAAQVLDGEDGGTRYVWTTDVLPEEMASFVEEMMEAGIGAIKRTLESSG